jgi:hypothetical protein
MTWFLPPRRLSALRVPSSRGVLSPSPLALSHHFGYIRRWTYLD